MAEGGKPRRFNPNRDIFNVLASRLAPPGSQRVITERIQTGHGPLDISLIFERDNLVQVNACLLRGDEETAASLAATVQLVSLAIQSGASVAEVAECLINITCGHVSWDSGQIVLSAPDAVALALIRYALQGEEQQRLLSLRVQGNPGAEHLKLLCPDCHRSLVYAEGCLLCTGCGWSKC